MIGDMQDMLARLKATLPARWFPDATPLLDAMLAGLAASWAWLYELLAFTRAQTRIATATGVWLDVIAQDFFGSSLLRAPGQGDDAYRARIGRALLREHGTRGAIVAVLTDLTGRAPAVFEPGRVSDTGSWGGRGPGQGACAFGYGAAGGWGSLALPFQCFVTAYRPHGNGIAAVAGWGSAAGGWGGGGIEYASLDMVQGQVTDAEIAQAVAGVLPATAIAWTRISN
jgi:hypothetical protein